MNIILVGYGKMGKMIEELAISKGHNIVHRVNSSNIDTLDKLKSYDPDVVIEFTNPSSALSNFNKIIDQGIALVTGTTGWYEHIVELRETVSEKQGSFLYASNFSVGVHILSTINTQLAKLMNNHKEFLVKMEEVHHLQKLDAPSGTAISLANQILKESDELTNWHLEGDDNTNNSIPIKAIREENVFGDHAIIYESDIDIIEIRHQAKSRKGFASGAILAAEWIHNKKGFYEFSDILK